MGLDEASHITVRWALQLPAVKRAVPEVLAGAGALDRPIRWAHVAEIPALATTLKGGELLLTTGIGVGKSGAQRAGFIDALIDRNAAALMIELGTSMTEVPAAVVAAAEQAGLPLIALHRPAYFVDITEAVHREIVNRNYDDMQRGRDVQRKLTQLALQGGGVPELLDAVAELIGNPAILEKHNRSVSYSSAHRSEPEAVLAAHDAVRRGLPDAPPVLEEVVPVDDEAAWGSLLAIGLDRPFEPADRIGLEQAASLIALALMRGREDALLTARHRGKFLTGLQSDRFDEAAAAAQAVELGFPRADQRYLLPIAVLRYRHVSMTVDSADTDALTAFWRALEQELRDRRTRAIAGLRLEQPAILLVVSLPDPEARTDVAERVATAIHEVAERLARDEQATVVCVGGVARSWAQTRRQLLDAADALPAAARSPVQRWHDTSRPDLARTLWSLRDSMHLRAFVQAQLDPIVHWDQRHGTQLLATLIAYCEHDGRKAETARALHVERQSLYHRISRIEALLGASLQDPDTRLGIQLALRATRYIPIRSAHEVPAERRTPV